MNHKQKIKAATEFLNEEYIKKLSESGIYFWIAGGSVVDAMHGQPSKDVDVFFKSKEDSYAMQEFCKDKLGFEWVKSWATLTRYLSDEMKPWEFWHFPKQQELTPEKCISYFDFTICACAVDSNLDFYYYSNLFQDLEDNRLVYTGNHYHLSNARHTTCMHRLKRYQDKGYHLSDLEFNFWLEANCNRTPLIDGTSEWEPIILKKLTIKTYPNKKKTDDKSDNKE